LIYAEPWCAEAHPRGARGNARDLDPRGSTAEVQLKVAQLYRRTREPKLAAPILEKLHQQDRRTRRLMARSRRRI